MLGQISGYMAQAGAKYAFLSTFESIWFMQASQVRSEASVKQCKQLKAPAFQFVDKGMCVCDVMQNEKGQMTLMVSDPLLWTDTAPSVNQAFFHISVRYPLLLACS